MLGRCYKAELSKLLKGKGIYIALTAMVLLIVFFAVLSSLLLGSIDIDGMTDNGIIEMIGKLSRDEYDTAIATLESQIEMIKNGTNTSHTRFDNTLGQLETYLAVLKYFKAHEDISINDVIVPMGGIGGISDSSMGFMLNAIELALEVAVIYGIIMLSSTLAGEMRDGTLRMQLLRANTRASLLTAKWLAVFTVSAAIMVVGIVIGAVYAAIHFRLDQSAVLYVVANSQVGVMDQNLYLFIIFIFALISMFALLMFSMFMCTITRYNRSVAMAIPIVVLLMGGLTAYLLQIVYLGMIDFPYCISLAQFIAPMGSTLPYTSLYTALPILVVYIVIFMTISYIRFKRTEL